MPLHPATSARPETDPATWSTSRTLAVTVLGGRRWLLLAGGSLAFVLHQVSEALVPVLIGTVVDRAIIAQDARALAVWLGVLAAVFTVLSLSWRLGMRAVIRVYSFGAHDLRHLVVRRTLDPRGLRTPRAPGEVLAVASSDTSRVAGLAWLVSSGLAAVAAVLTTAVSLLLVSVPLGLAVLVVTPLVLVAMHLLSVPLEARSEHEQATAAQAGSLATDVVTGLRVLKAMGAEDAAGRRYRSASRLSLAASLRAVRAKAGYAAVSAALASTFLAGIAVAAAWMALRGSITVGELVAVVGLAQFVQGPMASLGFLGVELAQKRASAVRVRRLLAEEAVFPAAGPGAAPGPGGADPRAADSRPGEPCTTPALLTLRSPGAGGPDAAVRTGEVVGVVVADPEAAARLVDTLGLRTPAVPGTVLLDGDDLATLSPARARSLVFTAEHDAALFHASVRENLLGPPGLDGPDGPLGPLGPHGSGRLHGPAELDERALDASGVTEVLTHLPDGALSRLTAHGRNLSGGQRQRVLLGRALHRPEPLLVLHDPTTAVDTMTEAAIARGLRAFPDKALVLVTTSPTLLAACDRVVFLTDDAHHEGLHHELVAHPAYAGLVSL